MIKRYRISYKHIHYILLKQVRMSSFGLLNKEQKEIFDRITKNPKKNFFVTGSAGTGKSFLLKQLVRYFNDKYKPENVGVTAMTGLAAKNINGKTLHSWMGLGLDGKRFPNSYVRERFKKTRVLIIDEISMMSTEYFDSILKYLKMFQVIFFGDFFQLPPVNSKMIFMSKSWAELELVPIVMKTVVRQSDTKFIGVLNNIRWDKITDDDIEYLKQFSLEDNKQLKPNQENYTCVYPINKSVDYDNNKKLKKIKNPEITICAKNTIKKSQAARKYSKKDYNKIEETLLKRIEKQCPQELKLKVGARVMLTKNQIDGPYVNGSIGVVQMINDNSVVVKFDSSEINETILQEEFEESNKGVKLTRMQVPLRLAWSNTIHRTQGLTIEKLWVTTKGSFEHGQCYVGISRARSPENLIIDSVENLIMSNKVSREVVDFYEKLN